MKNLKYLLVTLTLLFFSCSQEQQEESPKQLVIREVKIADAILYDGKTAQIAVVIDQPIEIAFSDILDQSSISPKSIKILEEQQALSFDFSYKNNGSCLQIQPSEKLKAYHTYQLHLSTEIRGNNSQLMQPFTLSFQTQKALFEPTEIKVGTHTLSLEKYVTEIPYDQSILLTAENSFIEKSFTEKNIQLRTAEQEKVACHISLSPDKKEIQIKPTNTLKDLSKYELVIGEGICSENNLELKPFIAQFYTTVSKESKLPVLSDQELLTKVQEQTFRYFWDFAHPTSGMARERNTSGDLVTSGGTGFGIMAILVGIERGFINKTEGFERLQKIVDFLGKAERFHGAWSHWLSGTSGKAIVFSPKDDGGDLVETAFLVQGLLAARNYFDAQTSQEKALRDDITQLWESVEWTWYTKGNQNKLYWHWSPNYAWEMNMPISGYNEAMIVYVLAASSPTYPISSEVYHNGWARNGSMKNGKEYYGITLPLGKEYGGPLFFEHYSFLGLDPRNLEDQYGNYGLQTKNHTLVNRAHCLENKKEFVGYGAHCWGLTSSDNHQGYSAHSPTNDLGIITPTAALSSFPYTPTESMQALRFFYEKLGDRLWGEYGFYDAFNLTENWFADSYLAIDQGPIIIMIENYRSALLWDTFMKDYDIQSGLNKLGFKY